MKIFFLVFLFFFPISCFPKPEMYYENLYCKGEKEAIIEGENTRIDCLTSAHAIEYEWAHKWYEAVGQSLYYAQAKGNKPGIVLLLKKESDYKYLIRLNKIIKYYELPIDVWYVPTWLND